MTEHDVMPLSDSTVLEQLNATLVGTPTTVTALDATVEPPINRLTLAKPDDAGAEGAVNVTLNELAAPTTGVTELTVAPTEVVVTEN